MKKILWITNNWLYEFGGRKIASRRIINHLTHLGHTIHVLNFEIKTNKNRVTHSLIELDKNVRFQSVYLKKHREILWQLRNIKYDEKFDIVICSGFIFVDLLSFISIKVFRLFNKAKIVLFEHNNSYLSTYLSLKEYRYFFYPSGILFYRFFDLIITPGFGVKNMLISRYGADPKRISIIPYPVIDPHIQRAINENVTDRIFHDKTKVNLITAMRLNIFQKDFHTLFKALTYIRKRVNAYLTILGEGPDKKKIISLAKKLGVFPYIKFMGFKKNPLKYIAKSKVFLFSSRFEGLPLVLIEALFCNVAIVSTDTSYGPREIIESGKNGILTPVGNAKLFASAVIKVINNSSLRISLQKNGKKNVEKYFFKPVFDKWDKFISHL